MSDPLDGKVDEVQAPLRQAESSSRRRRLRSAATKRRLYQLAAVDGTANNLAGKEAYYVESRADAFADSLVQLFSSDSTITTVKRSVNLDAEPSYVEFFAKQNVFVQGLHEVVDYGVSSESLSRQCTAVRMLQSWNINPVSTDTCLRTRFVDIGRSRQEVDHITNSTTTE